MGAQVSAGFLPALRPRPGGLAVPKPRKLVSSPSCRPLLLLGMRVLCMYVLCMLHSLTLHRSRQPHPSPACWFKGLDPRPDDPPGAQAGLGCREVEPHPRHTRPRLPRPWGACSLPGESPSWRLPSRGGDPEIRPPSRPPVPTAPTVSHARHRTTGDIAGNTHSRGHSARRTDKCTLLRQKSGGGWGTESGASLDGGRGAERGQGSGAQQKPEKTSRG